MPKPLNLEEIKMKAELFKMLADETRLAILQLLLDNKEMKVKDIQEELHFTQTKVSRHLDWLKRSELVDTRPHLTAVYYSIKPGIKDRIAYYMK
jgi:ArsR family transcriptional regulator